MNNTDVFYAYASEFQRKRAAIMDEYETRIKQLESAKGSQYYIDETKSAESKRNECLKTLRADYGNRFTQVFNAMRNANAGRTMAAPTDEELRLISALKMRDSLTELELTTAANTLKNNAACLSILQELANKNGIMRRYTSADNLSITDADESIKALADSTSDFMQYDTIRAARIAEKRHLTQYGTPTYKPLPKRPLFTDKTSCFRILSPGLTDNALDAFCAAVDG